MSRKTIFVLLGVFGVVLVFSYSAVIPTHNDPRAVPTDTPGPSDSGDGAPVAAAGRAIHGAQCAACHTIDGSSGIGPTWAGLWGSEVPLEDGSTVVADEAYIRESIQQPAAKVHKGFQPIMPVLAISDEDIENLIAFMQTLE
jgi:cytochrome c oxidase subunit II